MLLSLSDIDVSRKFDTRKTIAIIIFTLLTLLVSIYQRVMSAEDTSVHTITCDPAKTMNYLAGVAADVGAEAVADEVEVGVGSACRMKGLDHVGNDGADDPGVGSSLKVVGFSSPLLPVDGDDVTVCLYRMQWLIGNYSIITVWDTSVEGCL